MLDEKFTQTLFNHLGLFRAKPVLVGFSGGLDSTVLVFLLHRFKQAHPELRLSFSCVHVNHGLSPNANAWQTHCQTFCDALCIPLNIRTLELGVDASGNLEQRARDARYRAIAEVSPDDSILVLGHHLDDQAETLLFRLARGAGPKGLSAMSMISKGLSGVKFRPLLDVSKAELEAFAVAHNLSWIEDESNEHDDFDRNFIRNQLIPLASTRWPGFAKNLARSADLCHQQQQLLDEQCQQHLASIRSGETLNISLLGAFTSAWQNQILRMWLMEKNLPMPSVAQMTQLKEQILFAKDDRVPRLLIGGQCVSRYQDKLYVYAPHQVTQFENRQWDLNSIATLTVHEQSYTLEKCAEGEPGFCLQQVPVTVSFGGFGRRFKPFDSQMSKPLNQWFKSWKMPPWQRPYTPIFCFGDHIVQVGNKVIDEKATKGAACRYKIRVSNLT